MKQWIGTWVAGRTALINRDVDAVFDYVGLFELRDKGIAARKPLAQLQGRWNARALRA